MRGRIGGFAVLVALCWLRWPSLEHDVETSVLATSPTSPSPTRSRLARAKMAAPKALRPSEPTSPLPFERVTILLRHASEGILLLPRRHRLQPAEYWPLPGSAPFPSGEAAASLQTLMQQDLDPDDPQVQDWLDLALAEGLDPNLLDISDPWTAVLGMEVARREADLAQELDYQQALADGLGPENGHIRADALVGPPDQSALLDLANRLIDAAPSHTATEFARLYALEAMVQLERPDQARDLALDMLHHTDDALVATEAVHFLSRLPGNGALGPNDLDAMATFHDGFPELLDDPNLLVLALDQALRLDDGPRARDWANRYAGALDNCVGHGGVGCAGHRDNLIAARGYIGDVSPQQAQDWREGLELAGWACVRKGLGVPQQGLRGQGRWDEDWSWVQWEPANTQFEACLRDATQDVPRPNVAMKVAVAVIP